MNSRFHLLLFAAFVMMLNGCTTTSVPDQVKSQIKRVAIVSLFSHEIDVHHLGVFPVLHESKVEQTREWSAYTTTLSITDRLLRERGFETVLIDSRSSLLELPALPEPQNAVKGFLAIAREKSVDAIVVVSPNRMTSNGPPYYSVYFAPSRLFGVKSVYGGCVSSVYVFSDTGALLARSIDNGSFSDVPGVPWRESWTDYSAQERKAIYDQLEKIIDENLRWKLDRVL